MIEAVIALTMDHVFLIGYSWLLLEGNLRGVVVFCFYWLCLQNEPEKDVEKHIK